MQDRQSRQGVDDGDLHSTTDERPMDDTEEVNRYKSTWKLKNN